MKKLLAITALAALTIGSFSACKKSSSSPGYSIKATVGSKSFTGSYAFASSATGLGTVIEGGNFSGTAATPPYMYLLIPSLATGTYTISDTSTTTGADYYTGGTSFTSAVYGTITITNTSPVQGTFSFTLSDSTKVTGGSFTAQKL